MPTTKSAAKRLRQSTAQRDRNRSQKRALRTQCRKVRDAITAKDVATAEAELRVTASKLDQAGAHRVIHPNAAARTKSRLSAAVKAVKLAAKQ